MKRLLSGTILCAALALPALAQPPQKSPKPPVDQGRALAEAKRLVADAQADGIFEPSADAGGPVVRHSRSGLVCHFEYDSPGNGVMVFDKGPNRGNDVGCGVRVRDIVVTLYANRVADIGDVAKAEAGQVATIQSRYPGAKRYEGQLAEVNTPGGPAIAADRFEITIGERQLFTRAAAMRVGDWVFTQRVTAPKDVALAGDLLGGMMMTTLAKDIAAAK